MCPACIANAVLVAIGAVSTGGAAALAAAKLHSYKQASTNDEAGNRNHGRTK
jgi:hypothetical protein